MSIVVRQGYLFTVFHGKRDCLTGGFRGPAWILSVWCSDFCSKMVAEEPTSEYCGEAGIPVHLFTVFSWQNWVDLGIFNFFIVIVKLSLYRLYMNPTTC